MSLFSKIHRAPSLISVYLDFDGNLLPVNSSTTAAFYDSVELGTNWITTHFGKGSVQFKETSATARAGTRYQQRFVIRFPSFDAMRSVRTEVFHLVRNIKLVYNNGFEVVIGRNDYIQNRNPKVTTETIGNFLQVEFYTESITPAGFLKPNTDLLGFPEILPINFLSHD
ncbi:hypothetical protein [Flavobacterium sp. NKUCC04_CG]|uniref:hypothetical protein n=1 Tax=Flavobacterium sp. NKUCC04_CG TaxID=2842121 RepID=UPI001C5AF63C|nr:hypothetical protein [Flavobacterium sp. NKUCC04_CG]MBW3519529.1 hypothetical protein [Flavobacterium sp. NKUCC04_CG]